MTGLLGSSTPFGGLTVAALAATAPAGRVSSLPSSKRRLTGDAAAAWAGGDLSGLANCSALAQNYWNLVEL
jgi:hypothetical protein